MHVERWLHRTYIRFVRPRLAPMQQQRVKLLLWDVWGYWPLLLSRSVLSVGDRLALLRRCLRVDWQVQHAHKPIEISRVIVALAERRGRAGEVMVEAGCWHGGSTAKFSLACASLGYHLTVFDSFQGVQPMTPEEGETDFSGAYAVSEADVRATVGRFGAPASVSYRPGWFADSLRPGSVSGVRVAYIDCDVVEGTRDAMRGIVSGATSDVRIFTQDFHITPVRRWLSGAEPARTLGAELEVRPLDRNLAELVVRTV